MKPDKSGYTVYIHGGRKDTGVDALWWAKQVEQMGAGEILLTSMDTDGTKAGFDVPLTDLVAKNVSIPVIASGGGGTKEHFHDIFTKSPAEAALAATLFHFRQLTISEVKEYLNQMGIPVRM